LARIDVASFTCPRCAHRSTAPEAINAFAQQMELYEKKAASSDMIDSAAAVLRKQELEGIHPGNTVLIRREGNEDVTRFERSYAKITLQDKTELSESDHIVLACPQCDTVLYEVYSRETKAKLNDEGKVEF